jgi:hypothetical protein
MTIRQILEEIATPGSIYDEILDNILRPNLHLKPELISELAISFLEKEDKLNEVIKANYFIYYFIRTVTNNVRSNTSPFYRNNIVKERLLFNNVDIVDDSDVETKEEKELKYQKIDRAYVSIPKTYFQEFVWHEYFTKGKTYRQIGEENSMSYSIIFYEIKKIKDQLFDTIK